MAAKQQPFANEQDLIAQILQFQDDPLAFVMFAFPWGVEGTPLEHAKGPRQWQIRTLTKMRDHIRKNKKSGSIEEIAESRNHTFSDYSDLKEILNVALNKLNEIQRSVILLRDYEGDTYQEIGEITGLNESQVKVYIYRARVFLKNYIVSPEHVI